MRARVQGGGKRSYILARLHCGSSYYIIILKLGKGVDEIMQPQVALTITLNADEAELLQEVARHRLGQFNSSETVDLGAYIRALVDRDIAECVKVIKGRQKP